MSLISSSHLDILFIVILVLNPISRVDNPLTSQALSWQEIPLYHTLSIA